MSDHRAVVTDPFRIIPGSTVDLSQRDPRDTGDFDGGKDEGREAHDALSDRLEELQNRLYADGRHKVLVVLQAMDTGGKDGTIRHVFHQTNPQGVDVASFKRPTEEELAHDFLWRVHQRTPANGQIMIFNRSHYEDVLVVRVHGLVPEDRWRQRYDHIAAWEQLLVDEGTTIVKFFLHISKEEQARRLQARIDLADKRWKFEMGDIDERKHWDAYVAAYEEALTRTSTDAAPWYAVPADRKWFRNLVVSQVLVDTLEGLDLRYPEAVEGLEDVEII
jgi:PPK2 family polyphosphate:nucleotide phosphotransferase